ncbi:MAG: Ig-like domain-containing protein [Devosia sp.]
MSSQSDDFSTSSLLAIWDFGAATGASFALVDDGAEKYLELVTPDGNFDFWGSKQNAARVMQAAADEDLSLQAHFLSTPTERYQMQGFLIEGTNGDVVRIDTYSDGDELRLFGAVTVNGSSSVAFDMEVPGGVAPYLAVERVGDTFIASYSLDGASWQTVGSLVHAMEVSEVGVFAGNTGAATGFTAQVDWFSTSADPLTMDDGEAISAPLVAGDDALTVDGGATTLITIADLLANDSAGATLQSFGQPANGTLVDNGDGSLSYTPATGFAGTDTFTYVLADSSETTTAEVSLTVGGAVALQSDDFSAASLDPVWSFEGASGASAGVASAAGEAYLELVTPDGNFDFWGSKQNAARVMQAAADEDLSLQVHFLSTPTERYQMQGFLIEGTNGDVVRIDTYSDGNELHLFGAVTVNGSSSVAFDMEVPGGVAPYLAVERVGDTFTASYSLDGASWQTVGSLVHAMEVSEVGVFAGNTGAATGFTAQVDWFSTSADPLTMDDGEAISAPLVAGDDALTVDGGATTLITIADLLANDSAGATLQSFGQPANGTLVDNGDGTLSYTPATGFAGTDTFTYVLADSSETTTATVSITVEAAPVVNAAIVADDFSATALGSAWSAGMVAGTSVGVATEGPQSYLTLQTSSGPHALSGSIDGAYALQPITNGDFEVAAKFLSRVDASGEAQGLLVKGNASNWLAVVVQANPAGAQLLAIATISGVSQIVFAGQVDVDAASHLMLARDGDRWTLSHAPDGEAWALAGVFDHAMNVASFGVVASSVDGAFTAKVDYVLDPNAMPQDEDGAPFNAPPVASDDAFATDPDTPIVIETAALLANDTDGDGQALTVAQFDQPEHGTLTDNGDGTLTFTPDAGFAGTTQFTYTATDGVDASQATVTLAVGDVGSGDLLFSDDFSGAALDDGWAFLGIDGSASLNAAGQEAWLEIASPPGVAVDALNELTAPRVLQEVANTDFEVSIKFLNEPSQAYQEHGLLVVQDEANWIRFDVAMTSSGLQLIVGVVDDNDGSISLFKGISSGEVTHLRITREGSTFNFETSADGGTWTLAHTLTSDIQPTSVGPFAGSTSFEGSVPGFVSMIDWFETASAPLTYDDNVAPVAETDIVVASQDTIQVIDIASLLANDSDGDGDDLTLVSFTQPQNGALSDNGDGTLTFTPAPGFTGIASFSYTVFDGAANASADVLVAVNATGNDAPVAADKTLATTEDVAQSIDVLAGASDPNGDPLTIVSFTQGGLGTVADNGDGTLTYTPNPDASGADTFNYTISDGLGGVDTATVNVSIDPVNEAPVAVDDAVVTEAGVPIVIAHADLLGDDTDPDGDALTLQSFTQPLHGTLVDNGDGTLTYTPNAGYYGLDGFTYVASDGNLGDTATVAITVEPQFGFVSDDFSGAVAQAGWSFEGPVGSASLLQENGEGLLRLSVPTGNNDVWRTVDAPHYMQSVQDTDFAIEAKLLSVPTARTQMVGLLVQEDDANWIRFDTLFDGTDLRLFAAVTRDGVSSAILNTPIQSGEADYLRITREDDNWTLEYSSDGVAWNEGVAFSEAMVVREAGVFAATANKAPAFAADIDYVKVVGDPIIDDVTIPNPPVAVDDMITTAQGIPVTFSQTDLLANDSDSNGDPLTITEIAVVRGGVLTDDGNGGYTFTPDVGFTGVGEVVYTLSDGTGGPTNEGRVLIDVDNLAPVATDDAVTLDEDTSITVAVVGNDVDPNGDEVRVVSLGAALNGLATLNGDGTVTYTPTENWFGTETLAYTITDGILEAQGTLVLTVTSVDDAPDAVDDALFTPPDTALLIDPQASLFANDIELDGEALTLADLGTATNGTVVELGDGTVRYTPNAGFRGTDTFTYTVTDGTTSATATVAVDVRDAIEVWYGDTQTFGAPGEAQEWINILGNVATSGLTSLSYSLNGGDSRALSVGPDTRRLHDNGDFNADIAYGALDPTAAHDIVTLTATYDDGSIHTHDVTVAYEDGQGWSQDYGIDWSTVSDLQDVVQVADGTWAVEADGSGVRPVDLGYDRLLVLGDQSWDNYELRMSVTMHDLENVDPNGRDGGAFAFGMLWDGHTDQPVKNFQPKSGWEPGASIFFTGNKFKMHSYHDFGELLDVQRFDLLEGATYEFAVKVEQTGLYDRTYSLKVWETGTAEPVDWTVQGTETFSIDEAPATGSIYLNAHYFDVAFNDLSVTPIEGNDIIAGTEANDVLVGADGSSATPGRGEVDTFVGGGGADVFIFGDEDTAFYDSGGSSGGEEDLAFVWDFDGTDDVVQLHGSAADYRLADARADLPSGVAVYRVNPSGVDELIALLNTEETLSLDNDEFVFTADLIA